MGRPRVALRGRWRIAVHSGEEPCQFVLIGNPENRRVDLFQAALAQMGLPAANLVSYAGIVPRVSQTGGPESEPHIGSVAHRCNRILKDYIVQSASHIGLHGVADLMADHHRRDADGQHANYGIARRYLRIGMHLMRHSSIYLPARLRASNVPVAARVEYYQIFWPYLLQKWKKYGAHNIAFAPENPLGQWRNMIQDLYSIDLKM